MTLASASVAVAGDRRQVIVITGCTSGLGLALTREFIRLGHTVVGCGRRAEIVEMLRGEFPGSESSFHVVDVAKEGEVAEFARGIDQNYGDVDMLVANAGLGEAGKLPWEISDSYVHSIVDVNLKGLMFTNSHIIPIMLRGLERAAEDPVLAPLKRVINISSGVAHTSMPYLADYCAVKCGVEGYSKCVAQGFLELAQARPELEARILCVPLAPGVVRTGMSHDEDIPSAEVWCKDAAPYMLQIPASESGSSLTMPGYYSAEYMAAWTVPSGARMNGHWARPK